MRIFGKKFDYKSDTQLVGALIAGQQAAFDYVFDRYHVLLLSTIKSAFQIKNEEKAESVFKKRCVELQDYFLANDGAKLKLFDPGSFSFGVWLASSSSSFFKKIFCDENTALVEKYRNNDKAIVYERYKSDFEQKVRLLGETSGVDVSREALLFSDCLYKYLVNNDCKKLNTYDPSRQTFDAWFGWVLHNYTIDQYRKKTKKSNEDVYDIVYAKKNDDEMIEQGGLFRIDEQDTFYGWEKLILTLDDEEKIELMDIVRKTVETLQPPRYRDVLIDLYYKGDEYEIIAQRYQVTKANAQNIASRALKRLKEKLNEKGYRIKI